MVNASDVVIWSADVDRDTLHRVLTGDLPLQYIKLDRVGLTRMGLDMISEVQDRGFQVFADAKISEIPVKVLELAELHLEHKPWMLNVMAGISSTGDLHPDDYRRTEALKRFADLCHIVGTKPCAVTVLTSKSDEMVAREYNGRTSVEQVLCYAEMLLEAGFTDMVCSPLEAQMIRIDRRFDRLELNTPGVRLPGSDTRDQARVATPRWAIDVGVNRVVIGSDLTNGELLENFERIAAHLNA